MNVVRACIGLGSNIGDGAQTLQRAISELDAIDDINVEGISRFYRSAPWGGVDQPDFINAAVTVATTTSATALLEVLLAVERRFGRDRGADTVRWGPRTLDLDLLLYGGEVIDVPGLRVPHPHLHVRAFALKPLLDVMPGAVIPGVGPARDALVAVADDGIALQPIDALPYVPPRAMRD